MNIPSWSNLDSAIAAFTLGAFTLVAGGLANFKAAKHMGDTNIEVAKQSGRDNVEVAQINAYASNMKSMEDRLTELEARCDALAEKLDKKNAELDNKRLELTYAKTNEAVARTAESQARAELDREKLRGDMEKQRADTAETELVRLNWKLKNLDKSFRMLLEKVVIPVEDKQRISLLLSDDSDAVTELDIEGIGV